MPTVSDRAAPLPSVQLEDGATSATVVPGRGALVTSFVAGGRERLYLDERTLLDPAQNVRGGIPVLFPSPGKLSHDAFMHAGKSGAMKQHGFARNRAWTERARGTDGGAWIELRLADDDATRAQFPWAFACTLRFTVRERALRIDIGVRNPSAEPLPFAFGFHPYFAVPQALKAQARVPTRATRAWDNAAKREIAFTGLDLTQPEVDLHLEDHGGAQAELELPGGGVALRGSPELARWVIWTLAGKDFVCLEPWTAPGDALNTGRGLIELAPGASRALWLELEAR